MSKSKKQHRKWTEVYPYGTKQGDEEAKFFRVLARNPKYKYRSIAQLVSSTGLSKERIEEIIDKYVNKYDPPLIYPHPSNEDHWGYWERCSDEIDSDDRDIAVKDKDNRIGKHLGQSSPSIVSNGLDQDDISFEDVQSKCDEELNEEEAHNNYYAKNHLPCWTWAAGEYLEKN